MPNINFELNLNRHPKDVPNRALVSARNVQLSNDFSCLHTEYSIKAHSIFNRILHNKYLAGYIVCNKEFILFVAPYDYKQQLRDNPNGIKISLYRCKEENLYVNKAEHYDYPEYYEMYSHFIWNGGKIKGTFTYNIKSQLILAIAESDTLTGKQVPLKTINAGVYMDDEFSEDTDLGLSDGQLSLNPEIKIPAITNYNYVNGLAYKGWYTFFIRYKINSVDYTKWYDIGFPILIDELERVRLFNYFIDASCKYKTIALNTTKKEQLDTQGVGVLDYISSGSNTCNKTIQLVIDNKQNAFSKYQIGFIQSTKDGDNAFKSLDIDINTDTFLLDFSSLETYDKDSLLFQRYNYYNVKNVINYKNRLYCSNYKEKLNTEENINSLASKFKVRVLRDTLQYKRTTPIGIISDYIFALWRSDSNNIVIQQGNTSGYFNITNLDVSGTYSYNDNLDIDIGFNSGTIFNPAIAQRVPFYLLYDYFTSTGVHHPGNMANRVYINNNVSAEIIISDIELDVTAVNEVHEEYEATATLSAKVSITYVDAAVDSSTPETNYHYRLKNTTLLPGETYNFYVHFVNKYGEESDGILIEGAHELNPDTTIYSYAENNANKSMTIYGGVNNKYKTVDEECYIYYPEIIIDSEDTPNFGDYKGFFITYEKFQKTKQFCGILARYDFAYKKGSLSFPEKDPIEWKKHILYTAKLENNDAYRFRFYCTDIDAKDVLELNFTKVILEAKGFKEIDLERTTEPDTLTYSDSSNISEKNTTLITSNNEFTIKSAHYVAAHNFSKGNDFCGSYIEIEFENTNAFLTALGLTTEQTIADSDTTLGNYICKAILVANSNNLYLSENKQLIKFTNTFYFDELSFNETGTSSQYTHSASIDIETGLNGFCTFNTALIYNNNKVVLNSAYNLLVTGKYYSYITSMNFTIDRSTMDDKINDGILVPPVAYFTYIDYNNYPYESRRFKKLPEIISISTEALSSKESQSSFNFIHATIVEPLNSIDLFENNILSQDDNAKKIYINYNKNRIYTFDKRIIRSNPIADESFENSWRIFSPEAYKDITENKGNITNIAAAGTTFLIHTEHSLFMLDRDNVLQNGTEGLQLSMPDIFDVDYKEVVASYLGYGGLQDSDAYISDDFGYIYYDNDSNKFFRFIKQKTNSTRPHLEEITTSITEFINKYKPYKIRFGNDCENNRLIIYMEYSSVNKVSSSLRPNYLARTKETITISFNYKINKWISIHDYTFDFAFNTKEKLYLCSSIESEDTETIESTLYYVNTPIVNLRDGLINRDALINSFNKKHNIEYNIFENSDDPGYKESSISIMVNDAYELMKTLEFITWKLYKIKSIDENNGVEFDENTAREKYKIPYSGNKLRVYNDTIDTGYIDISTYIETNEDSIDNRNLSVMNYKKPWWELGNWNFNYLRDIKNARGAKAKFMSRLYGNYFIIELTFGENIHKERIEFETLNCNIINNQTI